MSNRLMTQLAMASLMMAGGVSAEAKIIAVEEEERLYARDAPRRKAEDMAAPSRRKANGSQPVPGGGARERARRLARMAKQQQD
jgi:hypothetical protein